MKKNILITGASGLIGKPLCTNLQKAGYQITVLTRNPDNNLNLEHSSMKFIGWNCESIEDWYHALEGQDIVINLAGANLASHRWNDKYKKLVYDSRINCTKKIIEAIGKSQKKPETFINASAVGYYGDRGDELLTEQSSPGKDFLAKLCNDWELAAEEVMQFGTRKVALRIGLVLSLDGGVLKNSLLPFKLFIGGKLGSGKQFFPWIHVEDLVNIVIHIVENDKIEGPINCASPGIVSEKVFASTLGRTLGRPSIFPVPRILLKAAVGEIADVIVSGQNISIDKLLNSGYKFRFPELSSALQNIINK